MNPPPLIGFERCFHVIQLPFSDSTMPTEKYTRKSKMEPNTGFPTCSTKSENATWIWGWKKLPNGLSLGPDLGEHLPCRSETSLVLRKDQGLPHPKSISKNPRLARPASGPLHTAHSQEWHKDQWFLDSCHLTRQRNYSSSLPPLERVIER